MAIITIDKETILNNTKKYWSQRGRQLSGKGTISRLNKGAKEWADFVSKIKTFIKI